MPIYEYECRVCCRVSELFLRSSEDRPNCPNCGSENLERLFSASHVMKARATMPGSTCCGRAERCDTPPCSKDESCRRDRSGR